MKKILFFALFVGLSHFASAQTSTPEEKGYQFTDIKTIATTPVKDQSSSGTCWSFSGNALLESELLRMGKGEVDLSEMWIVRHTYFNKAVKYVRMHGEVNFGGGGALHDVINVIREYGIVPEEVYPGLNYGSDMHKHAELDAVLLAYVKAVVSAPGRTLTTAWQDGVNGILDAYLGAVPEKFTYKGVEYTPKSYAAALGLNMDDYVSFTSFTHHPFYTQFALEIPDNWASGLFYNLPLEEFTTLLYDAVNQGYSIGWASDVSEPGFSYNKGLAVIPEADVQNMDDTEKAKWEKLTAKERAAALYKLEEPGKEKEITQELRQQAFDNYETTDDHGMQIVGIAKDQAGNNYYKVKNSWGTNQKYGGYFYASFPFVAYKTMNFMVHKDAVPKKLRAKLGIK